MSDIREFYEDALTYLSLVQQALVLLRSAQVVGDRAGERAGVLDDDSRFDDTFKELWGDTLPRDEGDAYLAVKKLRETLEEIHSTVTRVIAQSDVSRPSGRGGTRAEHLSRG